MKPIQIVLLLLGGLLVQVYFTRLRSLLLDRVIAVALAVGVMVLIVAPGITTWAAHLVGVGRGVDLVIYLALFLVSYVGLLQYSKIRSLEGQITDLVRALALDRARKPRADVLKLKHFVRGKTKRLLNAGLVIVPTPEERGNDEWLPRSPF